MIRLEPRGYIWYTPRFAGNRERASQGEPAMEVELLLPTVGDFRDLHALAALAEQGAGDEAATRRYFARHVRAIRHLTIGDEVVTDAARFLELLDGLPVGVQALVSEITLALFDEAHLSEDGKKNSRPAPGSPDNGPPIDGTARTAELGASTSPASATVTATPAA